MYSKLYEAWKKEKDSAALEPLPKDFYAELAEYARRIREESRMIDAKSTRAHLLMREADNMRKMVTELVTQRHDKIVTALSSGETLQLENLVREEENLTKNVTPSFESFQKLLKEIASGRLPQVSREKPKKRVLRFLKETPAIIGADMKTYGPFQPQDVASLPAENAKILTKQGIAIEIEVRLEPQ